MSTGRTMGMLAVIGLLLLAGWALLDDDVRRSAGIGTAPADGTIGKQDMIGDRATDASATSGSARSEPQRARDDASEDTPADPARAIDEEAPLALDAPKPDTVGSRRKELSDQDRVPAVSDGPRLALGEATDPPEDPNVPRFELVRMERDGQTVIAGRAAPRTEVQILLDGEVVDRVETDAEGSFVSIVAAKLGAEPRRLQLRVAVPELARALHWPTPSEPAPTDEAAAIGSGGDRRPGNGDTLAGLGAAPAAPAGRPTTEIAAAARERSAEPDPVADRIVVAPAAAETPVVPKLGSDRPDASPPAELPEKRVAAPSLLPGEMDAVTDRVDAPAPAGRSAFLTSAPVIALPADAPEAAPTLLKSTPDDLEVMQPSVENVSAVVLDRVSYGDVGDVRLEGRGQPGRAVRLYGNAAAIGTTRVETDGTWSLSIAPETGRAIKLLRLDEIDRTGEVQSRIEAPFTYSRFEPKVLREREVVVQRGDMLWRIAEQHYGEGLRYSLIYGANDELIRDPDLIYPGQVFTIPELIDAAE